MEVQDPTELRIVKPTELETLYKLLKKTDETHPDYEPLKFRIRELELSHQKAVEYRGRIILRILDLSRGVRSISRSRLCKYQNNDLIELGKLLKRMNELLDK